MDAETELLAIASVLDQRPKNDFLSSRQLIVAKNRGKQGAS